MADSTQGAVPDAGSEAGDATVESGIAGNVANLAGYNYCSESFGAERGGSEAVPPSEATAESVDLQDRETPNMARERPLPALKLAAPSPGGSMDTPTAPAKLLIPRGFKHSPPSISSNSAGTASPPRGIRLTDSLEAAVGERTGPGEKRRVLVSASSGINLRAAGSPKSGPGSRRARRVDRGKSMPASGHKGFGGGSRTALSAGTSPRTSRSPDAKRNSMSFGDFVAATNTELSLLDSSRLSTNGLKRPRDRNALRVAVRVRPLIEREQGSRTVACEERDGRMVVVNPKKFKASPDAVLATASAVSRANMATSDWLRRFDFDRLFWSTPAEVTNGGGDGVSIKLPATQQCVYDGLGERIVEDVLNGFNCSCFAYGHTGSGKTYSMFGCSNDTILPENSEALAAPPDGESFGLVPRVCFHLLRRLHETKQDLPHAPGTSSVGLSVQFIEIYNDKIRDLLHPGADSNVFRVREHPQTGPYVDNLVPVQVESWSQLRQLLVLGSAARTEADTPENSKSSRGHAILTLEIQSAGRFTRVQMVDLAGSEREIAANGRPADSRGGRDRGGANGGSFGGRALSQRLRETAQIKKALSNLGIIIKGLSRGDTPVGLPFRDSILTWLLKEALSGRAHTTMLATISPSSDNYIETMNTLKYAERLRRASVLLNASRDAAGPSNTKPSDGMKKEMATLVEKLGADGVEARRQVLYQTVSDPQQRIAKLTAKDPRRRRTSSGGSSLPVGARLLDADSTPNQRRTSLPGSPSQQQRFGWGPTTPSPPSTEAGNCGENGGTSWGSPIDTPDDLSLEGLAVGEREQDEEGGDGVASDDGVRPTMSNDANAGTDSAITADDIAKGGSEAGGPSLNNGGPERTGFVDDPTSKLYSESEGEGESEGREEDDIGDGGEDDPGGDDHEGVSSASSADRENDQEGNPSAHVPGASVPGDVPPAPPALQGDDLANTVQDEQQHQEWPTSPDLGSIPDWAGTSSSEETGSPGSIGGSVGGRAGADAAIGEPATDPSGNDPVTQFSHPPVSGRIEPRGPSNPIAVEGKAVEPATLGSGDASESAADAGESWARPQSAAVGSGEANGSASDAEKAQARPNVAAVRRGKAKASDTRALRAWARSQPAAVGPDEASESASDEGTAWAKPQSAVVGSVEASESGPDAAGTRARRKNGPQKHISWDVEENDRGGGGDSETVNGHVGAATTAGLGSLDDEAEGCLPDDLERIYDDDPQEDSVSPALAAPLSSSVESGGGAAALAASGLFDITGTSGEVDDDEDGISIGDADSLEAGEAQDDVWTPQQPTRERNGRQGAAEGANGAVLTDDTRRLIEDLMRQIEELKDSNAALSKEVQRLIAELRASKDSEVEAWALQDQTAAECRTRLTLMKREVQEKTDRAREAERNAREAESRAEQVSDGASDGSGLLEDARRRGKKAEQRAAAAEAREQEVAAHAEGVRAELEALQVALEEQTAATGRAQRKAEQKQAALDAVGGDVDSAVAAAQRTAGEDRERAAEAELRGNRAVARAKELAALVDDNDKRLVRSRKSLEEEAARADAAEARERRAASRAEELGGLADDNDKRLARAREALGAEETRADEAAERAKAAEYRVRELERDAEKQQRELDHAKREAEASLAEVRAAAEGEMERAATRRDAVIQERDRTLEQVEAERTEVLRLSAALNELRSLARQEAEGAKDREAALKGLLASESEASRAEQAEVEDLLMLISTSQQTDAASGGGGGSTPVSVSGARFTIEAQRAKYEAARRRLQALEDENRALRQSEEEGRGSAESFRMLEEERDFLLREKNALVDRLGGLEERQRSLQELDRQSDNREAEASAARQQLEEDLLRVKDELSRESALRANEAEGYAARLEEKDEQLQVEINTTIKQVVEGVKSQAGHIRGTVEMLEEERDSAIRAMEAANCELEDLKCQLENLGKEGGAAKNDFEEKIKQAERERAALWLAVNKLDVLEAAKDAAIKELQAEGENKSRALKVLQAHNAGLVRELGQVDLSLIQALEDNGLTLDNVNLQNAPISRRLGRRRLGSHDHSNRSITNGNAATIPPEPDAGPPPTVDADNDWISPNGCFVPARAITGAFRRDNEASWQRPPVATTAGGRGSAQHPARSRSLGRGLGRSPNGDIEEVSGTQAQHGRANGRVGASRDLMVDGGTGYGVHMARAAAAERRRAYNGSASSLQSDGWDPAINTIEREIEQLSERLNGQPQTAHHSPAIPRRAGSHADLSQDASLQDRERDFAARGRGVAPGVVGKRLRVSPSRTQDTQRPRRERGGLLA